MTGLSIDDQVVDHASRVPLSNKKRVLGVLLGQNDGNTINVANSYVSSLNHHRALVSVQEARRKVFRRGRNSEGKERREG